MQQWNGTQDTG